MVVSNRNIAIEIYGIFAHKKNNYASLCLSPAKKRSRVVFFQALSLKGDIKWGSGRSYPTPNLIRATIVGGGILFPPSPEPTDCLPIVWISLKILI